MVGGSIHKKTRSVLVRICRATGVAWMVATILCGVGGASARAEESPESVAAREQAQTYFDQDQARKAVATLAEAARHHPEDRVLDSMFYAALRDHVWYPPQTLPIRHGGPVQALTFSDDGKHFASGTTTGEVWVSSTEALDVDKAEAERIKLPNEEGAILGLDFTHDGTRLAVVSKTGGLRVWDLATKKVTFETPKPAQDVTAFGKSRLADVLAIALVDGTIVAADTDAGKIVATLSPPGGAVSALVVSRHGHKIAFASSDHLVRVWDVQRGSMIGQGLKEQGAITALDFSKDDRYVLTAGEGKVAKLWDPEEGIQVLPPMACGAKILKARLTWDGSMIATLLDDGNLLVWDALTGAKLDFGIREEAPMKDFYIAAGSLRAATASSAGHATLWTMFHGTRRGETIPHPSPVLAVLFSLDGRLLATGTENGEARLWRTDEGGPLTTVRHHFARTRTAFYSDDGQHLVTTSEDHTALHWLSGKVQPFGAALLHPGKVTCGTFNHDATRILTSDDTGLAHLWDAATGKPDGQPFHHSAPVNWVDFHPAGDRFVAASGPEAMVWSVTEREKPLVVLKHPGEEKSLLKSARFSPDGKWLVTASTDGTARIWDAASYKPVAVIDRHDPVWCARFSPDSSRLVVTGEDCQAVVYDVATWKPVGTPVLAAGLVFSAAITDDNRFVVISSLLLDAVQFYEIATGRPLGDGIDIHTQATCVDYLHQDKVVVVACDDGSVRSVGTPFITEDAPGWMCDFAEHFIGLRQTGPDKFERVETHVEQLRATAERFKESKDDFPRLATWLLTTGNTRHGMPRFTSTLAANIAQRMNEQSLDALFECYGAISSDPLVLSALSLYLPNRWQGEILADYVLNMPDPEPLARCYAAGTLILAGRSGEAQVIMAKAVADAPENPLVLRRAAKLEARLFNKQKSVDLFEKTIRLAPDDYEAHRAYGWALYHFHEPARAAEQFRRAEELVGNFSDDLIAGICLSEAAQDHIAEATAAYQRLIILDPVWKEAKHLQSLRGWVQEELDGLERVRQQAVAKE